jgi:hypothetical protein
MENWKAAELRRHHRWNAPLTIKAVKVVVGETMKEEGSAT